MTADLKSSRLNELNGLILKLADIVSELSAIEQEKAQAVSLYRHRQLEACIRREQAAILKLRGAEEKRLSLMKALGWEGLSLSQLLSALEAEPCPKLQGSLESLREAANSLLAFKADSERILNVRLHALRKAGQAEEQKTARLSRGGTYV